MFSSKYGWRLSGTNVEQLKYYLEYFLTDFQMMSVTKIVLPYIAVKGDLGDSARAPSRVSMVPQAW